MLYLNMILCHILTRILYRIVSAWSWFLSNKIVQNQPIWTLSYHQLTFHQFILLLIISMGQQHYFLSNWTFILFNTHLYTLTILHDVFFYKLTMMGWVLISWTFLLVWIQIGLGFQWLSEISHYMLGWFVWIGCIQVWMMSHKRILWWVLMRGFTLNEGEFLSFLRNVKVLLAFVFDRHFMIVHASYD